MAIRRQAPNPMDFAKKLGRERLVSDVVQDIKLQQAKLPEEMSKFSTKSTGVDMFSNFLASYGTDILLGFLTGGTSTPVSIAKKLFGSPLKIMKDKEGALSHELGQKGLLPFKWSGKSTEGLNLLTAMGLKGGIQSGLGGLISGGLKDLWKIKAPEAPTIDMSRLKGPGMGDARKSIEDLLALSDVGYTSGVKDVDTQSKILNYLASFGPLAKEDLGGGKSIMDYLGLNIFDK
jgi:hypothetical protein